MFKVSKGNSKLGKIYNWNLPAIVTCRKDAPCIKDCYACKGFYRMKSVKNCYAENLRSFIEDPKETESDIFNQLPESGYCRIHSSGDFYNMEYLEMCVRIAEQKPKIKFLAFTKKYELVNEYMNKYAYLPDNFTIVFSCWEGLVIEENTFAFPYSLVLDRDIDIINHSFPDHACIGSCVNCKKCWELKRNKYDFIIFAKH